MKRKDNIFTKTFFPRVDTNRFDLSHDVKLSFKMGALVPTNVMEVLPGDIVNISVQNMLRFAPLISPVMHRVRVTTDYYFVPNRILWSSWEKFITGDDSVQAPYFNFDICEVGSLCDYMGLPTTELDTPLKVSPLKIAAYLKIYDDFYRDQNLGTEMSHPVTDGNNAWAAAYTETSPLNRAWEHDYFTSALPFAQKGDAVQIPLTFQNNIPVTFDVDSGRQVLVNPATGDPLGAGTPLQQTAGPSPIANSLHLGASEAALDPAGTLSVDIQSDATDINTLRRAFRLQEWLEKNARGGTRYVESLLAHFGVRSSDARLQRPEFIGRQRQNMVISEVLATAQDTADNVAVGTMAGHGISVGSGGNFNFRAEEHGFIIGIINVQPDTAYQQGVHRDWTRFDSLDYAFPTFANIGEQEIKQKEIYAESTTPEAVFGYIPRYSEYKFQNSRVAGEMRSTLSFWHMGRIFATDPHLNEDFIKSLPITRIFAVTDPEEDHIYAHIYNKVSAVRKLPRYGTPTI
jgi:hypothetical protein